MHSKAIIKRPADNVFNTQNVIKADQLPQWHKKFADRNISAFAMVKLLANMRSQETVKTWGEMLIQQHRPVPPKRLPEHLFPAAPRMASDQAPQQVPVVPQAAEPVHQPPIAADVNPGTQAATSSMADKADKTHLARKLICAECGDKITYAEGKFCWGNERRFKGLQYFRDHQALFR